MPDHEYGESPNGITVKWSVLMGAAALAISVLGSAIFVGRMFDRLEQLEGHITNFTTESSHDRGELHAQVNNIRERMVGLEGRADEIVRNETRIESMQRTLDEVRGKQIDAIARLTNLERLMGTKQDTFPVPPGPH